MTPAASSENGSLAAELTTTKQLKATSCSKCPVLTHRKMRSSLREPPRQCKRPTVASAYLMPTVHLQLLLLSLLALETSQQQQQQPPFHLQYNATPSSMSFQLQPHQQQPAQTGSRPNYLETGRQITGILDRFMSLGYDKRVRPNYGGPPVEVNVTMRILSISSVSEVMMDFTADFYFRQTWHDPRLSFRKLGDIQTLYVGAEVSKKIWLPDTFFGNEKMAYFHEATTPNVFLRIDHSGEVYRSIRLTVTSSCPMNLQYFPMDRQRCTIEAESYGYNVKDIIYRWARKDTAVERDKEISLPQFDIVQTVQKYRLEELSSGTYSRLIAEIHFARRMGYYLIQIYIPSSLIVVISWVSFWLHRNASPARVQLGVTTVLTMTTLMSSTNAALPKISYVKSIDIFLGTCFVMVFAALLEYATVGYLGKRIAMRKAHAQHAQSQAQAKLYAHLQAQGAQGEPVPLVMPVPMSPTSAAAAVAADVGHAGGSLSAPGQTTGNLALFGNNADSGSPTQGDNNLNVAAAAANLLSAQSLPLSALLGAASFLPTSTNTTTRTAATPQQSSTREAEAVAAGRQPDHCPAASLAACQQAATGHHHLHHRQHMEHSTACFPGEQACAAHQSNQRPAGQSATNDPAACRHCRKQEPPLCSSTNCLLQQQQHLAASHCHHRQLGSAVSCSRRELSASRRDDESPPEPPVRGGQFHLQQQQQKRPHSGCQCQSREPPPSQASSNNSQTLPRNLAFPQQQQQRHHQHEQSSPGTPHTCCPASHAPAKHTQPPSYGARAAPTTTGAHLSAPSFQAGAPQQISSALQASPRKGGSAAAAAAAAATFVNLHRRNKGLPPSTNPNFAPFNASPLAPYSRHLETIFGIRPSDIDKYSRVVFPVCFVCFQLMYWIVYLHISAFLEPDRQQQQATLPVVTQPVPPSPAPMPTIS